MAFIFHRNFNDSLNYYECMGIGEMNSTEGDTHQGDIQEFFFAFGFTGKVPRQRLQTSKSVSRVLKVNRNPSYVHLSKTWGHLIVSVE